jgi:subtilisin family serine protease
MNVGRIDPRLTMAFDESKKSASTVQSAHGVAASINDDVATEILKELPAVGPVTYLSELEVVLADIEKDGFDYLVENREVHAISDAELLHEPPMPMDVNEKYAKSSRSVMRGQTELFSDMEGRGITVGVMDSGVFREHECFGDRVSEQVNCVPNNHFDGDIDGHGTHVAGTIAGTNYGVASEASILDLRVFGYYFGRTSGATTSSLLQAMNVCIQQNVDIVNMSLGGDSPSRVLDGAVDTMVQSGVITCIAAGNSGPRSATINSPSSARLAISVAATDHEGYVTSFSSRGPNPWYSWQKPDLAGFGLNVLSASRHGGATVMSGTSMATPGVAGVLACLLEAEKDNNDSAMYVDALLRDSANPLGQTLNEVGHGFVSLPNIELYLNDENGLNALKKRKTKKVKKNFFKESVLKCELCNSQRIVHQISHRSDETLRVRMSCTKDRKKDSQGKPIYDEVVLENWKHTRITDKQYIQALRKCGGCGKLGLVPIESSNIELSEKHKPHSKVKVGCLYCGGKGERKIPTSLLKVWS